MLPSRRSSPEELCQLRTTLERASLGIVPAADAAAALAVATTAFGSAKAYFASDAPLPVDHPLVYTDMYFEVYHGVSQSVVHAVAQDEAAVKAIVEKLLRAELQAFLRKPSLAQSGEAYGDAFTDAAFTCGAFVVWIHWFRGAHTRAGAMSRLFAELAHDAYFTYEATPTATVQPTAPPETLPLGGDGEMPQEDADIPHEGETVALLASQSHGYCQPCQ
jgi:hypothetical protein